MTQYAFPLEVRHGDLDRKESCLSGDTDFPGLINEELPDSIAFIMGKLGGEGERVRGGGVLESISIFGGRERRRSFLERIVTTGLTHQNSIVDIVTKSF